MKNTQINETITKNSANLDDIVNNTDEMDEILNSREFITTLVNDLINKKRNITEWTLVDSIGGIDGLDPETIRDTFGVDYEFNFKYKYKDHDSIPLTLYISGEIPFKMTPRKNGNWFSPPEGGEATTDHKNLGPNLDLGLFDKEGGEIGIKFLTPEIQSKVAKEILQDYV
jgi:hypothetical protein